MILKSVKILSSALLIVASASFMFSCGGDDDDGDANDCNVLSNQIGSKTEALLDAIESEDCTAIENAYNDLIDLYEDGHECDAFEEAVEDAGFDTYNEYIEYLEEQRDLFLADC
jgi:hypothetical protein